MPQKITKDNFEKEVVQHPQPVLLDFWAEWCGPCRMITPVLAQLESEVETAKIGQVNVDEQPELAQKFAVISIPTLIVLKNGQEISRSVGLKPKAEILKMLQAASETVALG